MATNIQKFMMILVAISTVVACSKSNNDRAARDTVSALGVAGNTSTCQSSQQAVGRVYDSSAGSSFEQRVKGLLSATVNPTSFGTISGSGNDAQSGVTLEGRLRYDTAGNVTLDQTNLRLVIYDSYVGQKDSAGTVIQPFPINFTTASAGTVNLQTKQFNLQFKDSYGEINLTGTINASTVTGTISYANYTSIVGGANASGVLGNFTIATCGWVN